MAEEGQLDYSGLLNTFHDLYRGAKGVGNKFMAGGYSYGAEPTSNTAKPGGATGSWPVTSGATESWEGPKPAISNEPQGIIPPKKKKVATPTSTTPPPPNDTEKPLDMLGVARSALQLLHEPIELPRMSNDQVEGIRGTERSRWGFQGRKGDPTTFDATNITSPIERFGEKALPLAEKALVSTQGEAGATQRQEMVNKANIEHAKIMAGAGIKEAGIYSGPATEHQKMEREAFTRMFPKGGGVAAPSHTPPILGSSDFDPNDPLGLGAYGLNVMHPSTNPAPIEPRQEGGPVRSGLPYLVGEAGPEIMIPHTSGTIRKTIARPRMKHMSRNQI